MIVVADAGPLMALAKVGALDVLLALCRPILTTASVYEELVTQGLEIGAEDAVALSAAYARGDLEVVSGLAPVQLRRDQGELDTIHLAVERSATWVLLDDLRARRAALRRFAGEGVSCEIKGTLGVIASAVADGHVPALRGIEVVRALQERSDVWIEAVLYERVLDALERHR